MHPSLLIFVSLKLAAVLAWSAGAPLIWACVVFFGCDVWLHYQVFAPGASGLLRTYTRFRTDQKEVWLTIDDGPDAHDTPRILDLLDRYEAKATFFVIGERAALHPELVAEIVRRGHEIGHHTHTHPSGSFWCASRKRLRKELDLALAVLSSGGIHPRLFRCPVGIKNVFLHRELRLRGLRCMGWSVRSRDSFARDPDKVVTRVLRHARPGSVLLLHEGPPLKDTVRVCALAGILKGLHQQGLRCVLPTDAQLR